MHFSFYNNEDSSTFFYKYLYFCALFCNSFYERNGLLSNIYTNIKKEENGNSNIIEHNRNKIIYCFSFHSLNQLNNAKTKIFKENNLVKKCNTLVDGNVYENDIIQTNNEFSNQNENFDYQQKLIYTLEVESNQIISPIIFHVGNVQKIFKNADYPKLQLHVNNSWAHFRHTQNEDNSTASSVEQQKHQSTKKSQSILSPQSVPNSQATHNCQKTLLPIDNMQDIDCATNESSDWDKAVKLNTPILRIINNLFCALDIKSFKNTTSIKTLNNVSSIYDNLLTKALNQNKPILFTLWEHHFFFDRALFIRSPLFQYFLASSVLKHSNFCLIEWMHTVAWMTENQYQHCAQPFFCALEEHILMELSSSNTVKQHHLPQKNKSILDDLAKSIAYLKDPQQHCFSQKITNFFVVQIEHLILNNQLNNILCKPIQHKKCLNKTL